MHPLIRGMSDVTERISTGPTSPRWLSRSALLSVMLALNLAAWPLRSPAGGCAPPVLKAPLPTQGSGDSVILQWDEMPNVIEVRVWAQWRIPEGEVVRTQEVVMTSDAVELPPSPRKWHPLKLSVELQSFCQGGLMSPIAHLRQLQYDAKADAACPAIENFQLDGNSRRLSWTGATHDKVEIAIHGTEDGRLLERREVVGKGAEWPVSIPRPAAIRAVRACGEAQRSRPTFLLVR